MVMTKKFSEFTEANLSDPTNKVVGVGGGVNFKTDKITEWTTGARPLAPLDGVLGFNTTIHLYEYWDATANVWQQLGTGDAGTVTQVDTGTGLTGGPIITSGTVSFATIAANSFWANTTGVVAVPTVTSLSAFLLSANNLSDLPNKVTARTNLGVAIGSNVEAWSVILDQISAGIWAGSSSITTLGTVSTGTWHGSTIDVAHGGSGKTSFTAYAVICAGTSATNPFQNVSGIGTTGQVLTSNGAGTLPTWQNTTGSGTVNSGLINQVAYYASAGTTLSGLATSNSGVLITSVGGVPSISSTLPVGVQTNITQLGVITVGSWQSTPIALAFGGTNANLTASNGGIFYSTATAGAILAGTSTSNQILMSGASSSPSWSTAVYPVSTTINQLLYSSSANNITGLATMANATLVTDGSSIPSLSQTLPSNVQGNITEVGTIASGVWNGTPVDVAHGGTGDTTFTAYAVICGGTTATGSLQNVSGLGTGGQVLTSNGAGTLPTWQNAVGAGTVNAGTINDLAFYASSTNAVSPLTTANNGVLVTSNTGVPSISSTLPAAVQGNITALGTITSGVWNGSTIDVPHGGTGNTTFTAFSVICAGTSATAPFQNVSGLGSSGQVLTSNGAGGLPTWQNTTGSGTVNSGAINDLAYYAAAGSTISGLATANNGVLITSAGGVPSISSTLPLAVQTNITELGVVTVGSWDATPVALAFGGTNANLTANNGGIFYSTATAGAILLGTATANQILMSGASSAPSWSTATYPSSTSINRILYSSAANVVGQITTLASGILITDVSGVPSISQTLPSTVQGNITALGTITSGIWNGTTIDVAHGGTGNTTFTAFSLIAAGTTATGPFENVSGVGSSGQVLTSNGAGTLPTWQASAGSGTVNSGTANQLAYYATTGTAVSGLASANGGVLVTSNTGVPSILAGSGTTGTMLQATESGTPAWSTTTWPATATVNRLLWVSATNVISDLATGNNGVLVTSAGGVPSISSTLPAFTTSSITFSPTTGGIVGTTTNDNAAAGKTGEYISAGVLVGSAVALTTGVSKTVTNISLTAGDWDVSGSVISNPAGTTTSTSLAMGISIVNNTFGTLGAENNFALISSTTGAAVAQALSNGSMRLSLSGTTTVYLIASSQFAVSTMGAYGFIGARRVR